MHSGNSPDCWRKNLMRARVKKTLFRGLVLFRDPYYQGFAAQLAFFIILSMIPMLMLLSQLLGIFDVSFDKLKDVLGGYVNVDVLSFAVELLEFNTGVTSNIFFTLIALWAASRAQFALIRMGSYTMSGGSGPEYRGYGFIEDYIRARIRSLLSIIVILITFTAGLIVLVYGEVLFKLALATVTNLLHIELTISTVWLVVRWPIALAVYFFVIWINYSLMSHKRIPMQDVVPGAIFASIGIIIVTFLYAEYINLMADYNLIYGALAAIVALMFWVYFISWCLGLGLIWNRAWSETTDTIQT